MSEQRTLASVVYDTKRKVTPEPVNENETFERKVYEGMRTIAV